MMKRGTQAHAERINYGRRFAVQFFGLDGHGDRATVSKPLQFGPINDAGDEYQPALVMPPETAQQLMDALWDCGLRPTQGQQSHGQFAAQGRHLEDMRVLVAAMTKVELPK